MSDQQAQDQGARQRLDFMSGAVLTVLCLLAILWIIPTYVPGEASRGEMAPSFFPNLASSVVLACAIGLMVVNFKYLSVASLGLGRNLLIEILGWAIVAGITFALFAYVGFVAASVFSVAAGVLLSFYRKKLWMIAIIAIGLPLFLKWGVYALFYIQLP